MILLRIKSTYSKGIQKKKNLDKNVILRWDAMQHAGSEPSAQQFVKKCFESNRWGRPQVPNNEFAHLF